MRDLNLMRTKREDQKSTTASMKGKTAVITGANSGVGFEAAISIGRAGGHVVMVCRNPKKAEDARAQIVERTGAEVDVVLGDLSDMVEVRKLCADLLERFPKIHVLINNAGLHSTVRSETREGFETVFAVNHLAPFLMTLLLLDRLKESAPARIINVSSQGHRFNGLDLNDVHWEQRKYRGLKGYGAAKTANLMFTWDLAEQLRGSGVTVVAQHPGAVKTGIGLNNGAIYRAWHNNVTMLFLQDASIAGDALYYLAAAPELSSVTGRYFNLTNQEKPAPHALNRAVGRICWSLSERLCGLATIPEKPAVPAVDSAASETKPDGPDAEATPKKAAPKKAAPKKAAPKKAAPKKAAPKKAAPKKTPARKSGPNAPN